MLFPKRLIELGTIATYEKSNLINVTNDQKLLDLSLPKQSELYATSYFYQKLTNFSTEYRIFFLWDKLVQSR